MRLIVQRVIQAAVMIEGRVQGAIDKGLLVFLGITHTDTNSKAAWLAGKLIHLRMFQDDFGKVNRSVTDIGGSVLIISQFTLYGDCAEGRRPSFTEAAPPTFAEPLYEQFIDEVRKGGIPVQTGLFGAEMKVSLVNDGPFTLILER